MKEIKITVPEEMEINKDNSSLETVIIKFKKKKPKEDDNDFPSFKTKYEGYINIYISSYKYFPGNNIYNQKKEAIAAGAYSNNYIATVKINFEA